MVGFTSVGELAALPDQAGAALIRKAGSEMRNAVDERVHPVVVTELANNPTILDGVEAAVDAEVDSRNLIEGDVQIGELSDALQAGVLLRGLEPFTPDQTNGYFTVSGGSVTVTTISSWERGHVPVGPAETVKPGDTLFLGQPSRGTSTWGTIPVLIIEGTAGILRVITWDDFPEGARALDAEPLLVTIPKGATGIYFNHRINVWVTSPSLISDVLYRDERLDRGMVELGEPLSPVLTETDRIFSIQNWGITLAGYSTYAYPVSPGDKIRITGTLPASGQFNAGFFMGELGANGIVDGKPLISFIDRWYVSGEPTAYDMDVTVPGGAHFYIVSNNNGAQTVTPYVLSAPDTDARKPLTVTRSGYTVNAISRRGNGVEFQRFGGNNIVMPRRFVTAGFSRQFSTDTVPGPYVVEAATNGNGDRPGEVTFTGGNHAYNGDATGTPTAVLDSFTVYSDGVVLPDGAATSAEVVEIVAVNLVQASNTCLAAGGGRPVLRETIRYRFDGEDLRVSVTVEPLENITISRYYGLQLAGFTNGDYDVYLRDRMVAAASGWLTGDDLPYAIVGSDANGSIVMQMERAGLGTYAWNATSDVATVSSNKGYFVPIRDGQLFTPGDRLYLAGVYRLGRVPEL